MIVSELEKVAKERHSWDFWQVLDFGCVCSVQVSDYEEDDCDGRNADCLVRHYEE